MDQAVKLTKQADIFLIIGTSLAVYPAASLIDYTKADCQLFLIDPKKSESWLPSRLEHIQAGASKGVEILKERLISGC
jgi:NAD-dependent deacetylase